MCGILARLGSKTMPADLRPFLNRLQARGPESTRLEDVSDTVTFGFTRLAINGLTDAGMQPFKRGPITWICNGEIYNFKELEHKLKFQGASDCECLGELYLKYRDTPTIFLKLLDGVFALILYDSERNTLLVTRDPYGVRPLFIATKFPNFHSNATLLFVSEIKAAIPYFDFVTPFLPGWYNIYDTRTNTLINSVQYHSIPWITQPSFTPFAKNVYKSMKENIRLCLKKAVEKRIPLEVEPACLLSGGIDSSLIASLVQLELKEANRPRLKTFSIGFEGSSDLKHAKIVADWIDSDHTEIVMTPDDFFKVIPEVIRAIETCDTTTVRASVGNYLVSKKIKELSNCKVVFNGDGSDELFGGYLYFNNCPSEEEFQEETGRLLQDIFLFDVLRSDRCVSAHGLEARTPFLDKQFVALVRCIHPSFLRPKLGERMEKELLRNAFDDGQTLPPEVLWRRKEAFSDGVSGTQKSWYKEIEERIDIPECWKDIVEISFSNHLPPRTPEEFYYRQIFCSFFTNSNITTLVPYRWMPRWCPDATDPSARTLSIY